MKELSPSRRLLYLGIAAAAVIGVFAFSFLVCGAAALIHATKTARPAAESAEEIAGADTGSDESAAEREWSQIARIAIRQYPSKPVEVKGSKFLVKWHSMKHSDGDDGRTFPNHATIVILGSDNRQLDIIDASFSGEKVVIAPAGKYRFYYKAQNMRVTSTTVYEPRSSR